MMSVALEIRNPYEQLEIEEDVLFFKLGAPGLVCFHGRNYNMKRRMTAEQIERLTAEPAFYRIGQGCYVNVKKISSIENDKLYFGEKGPDSKVILVSKRHQAAIRSMLVHA